MPAIPYLSPGDTIDHEKWNTLFEELDRKLSLALDDHSLCFWYQKTDGAEEPQPRRQWNKFLSQRFFFLGEETRFSAEIFAGTTDVWGRRYVPFSSNFGGWVDGVSSDYFAYWHAPFEGAVASTPFSTAVPNGDPTMKIVRLQEPALEYYETANRAAYHGLTKEFGHSAPNLFDFSLEQHKVSVAGFPDKFAIICGDSENPEFIHRDAQPELVFDGLTEFDFPAHYNKYNFFRVHNLGLEDLTLSFKGSNGETVFTLEVPALGSRCVRRDDVDSGYLEGFNHFQKYKAGDGRFYNGSIAGFHGAFGAFLDEEIYFYGIHRFRSACNNVVNPQIIFYLIDEGKKSGAFQWFLDAERFWNAAPLYCGEGKPFPAIGDDVLLGDLVHHAGKLKLADTFEGATTFTDINFTGYANIEADFAAAGITVTVNSLGNLALTAEDDEHIRDIITISTNLFVSNSEGAHTTTEPDGGFSYPFMEVPRVEDPEDSHIGIITVAHPTDLQRFFYAAEAFEVSSAPGAAMPFNQFTTTGSFTYVDALTNTTSAADPLAISRLDIFDVVNPFLVPRPRLHTDTVGDLKTLNYFGSQHPDMIAANQENDWTAQLNKGMKMTGFGLLLHWDHRIKLKDEFRRGAIDAYQLREGIRLLGGRTITESAGELYLLEKKRINFPNYGFPDWKDFRTPYVSKKYNPDTLTYSDESTLNPLMGAFQTPRLPEKYSTLVTKQKNNDVFAPMVDGDPDGWAAVTHPDFTGTRELGARDSQQRGSVNVKSRNSELRYLKTFDLADGSNAHIDKYVFKNPELYPGVREDLVDRDIHTFTPLPTNTFNRIPLSVDHYNNLASLVNAIARIIPLNFFSFYNHLPAHQLPEYGGSNANSGIFNQKVQPADCYCFVSGTTAPGEFTAVGATLKTIDDMPAAIKEFIRDDNMQQRFVFPGTDSSDFSFTAQDTGAITVFSKWKNTIMDEPITGGLFEGEVSAELRANLPILDGGVLCPLAHSVSFVYERLAGITDQVEIHCRLLAELKGRNFSGPVIGNFQIGGHVPVNNTNVYRINVSDPPQVYFLNIHTTPLVQTNAQVLDYTQAIPIKHGATVTLTAESMDGRELPNGNDLVIPGLSPFPDPYEGQFAHVKFTFQPWRWVSITDLKEVAEEAGFKFVFQRECIPLKLKIIEAETASVLYSGDPTGGGYFPKTYAFFHPVMTDEETEWIKPVDSFRVRTNRIETPSRMLFMIGAAHDVIVEPIFAAEDADWVKYNFGGFTIGAAPTQQYKTAPKPFFTAANRYLDHANRCIRFINHGGTATALFHRQAFIRFEDDYTAISAAIAETTISLSDPANQRIHLHKIPGEVVAGGGTSRKIEMEEGENYVGQDVIEEPEEADDICELVEFWLNNEVSADD